MRLQRSRPPEGATHIRRPSEGEEEGPEEDVCLKRFKSSDMVVRLSFCFEARTEGEGDDVMCFLEWMHRRLRPIENGIARGSVVTLWPATKIIEEAKEGKPSSSSARERTCGSASLWWLESKTTLIPEDIAWAISFTEEEPVNFEEGDTNGRKKSLPNL